MSGTSNILKTICDKYSCKPTDTLGQCYAEKSINPPSVEYSGTLEHDFRNYPEDTWDSTTCASLKDSRIAEVRSDIAAKKLKHAEHTKQRDEVNAKIGSIVTQHAEVVRQLKVPSEHMNKLEAEEQERLVYEQELDHNMTQIINEYKIISESYLLKKSEEVDKYLSASTDIEIKDSIAMIKALDEEFLTKLEKYKADHVEYNAKKIATLQHQNQLKASAQESQNTIKQLQQVKSSLEEQHAQHTKHLGELNDKIGTIVKEHDELVKGAFHGGKKKRHISRKKYSKKHKSHSKKHKSHSKKHKSHSKKHKSHSKKHKSHSKKHNKI